MAGSWGSVPRRRLMETIVILWTLNEVPAVPNVQQAAQFHSEGQKTRQLTFEREQSLVEILAFLAGTTDDPSKVTAICVEEALSGESLTIRLAVNSGDCSDTVTGFKRLAKILEHSSKRVQPRTNDCRDLLRAIIRLDFWRILSRLRSKHSKTSLKTKGKPALVTQLSSATRSAMVQTDHIGKFKNLKSNTEGMKAPWAALEALPCLSSDSKMVQENLIIILEHANNIAKQEELASALKMAQDLDPSTKTHLVIAVGKLGRYFSASQDLVRAVRSKNNSIFSKILVESYRIPPTQKPLFFGKPRTLQSSVDDMIKKDPAFASCVQSCWLKQYLGKSYSSKSSDFQTRTSASPSSWKVHAEIQLLFFYELHEVELPPRVICASKSPCYLCHLFCTLHGRFHVPETHGRLYSAWILPTWLDTINRQKQMEIGHIIDAFYAALVHRIQAIAAQERKGFTYPNESTLWTAAKWSASTLQSRTRTAVPETSNPAGQSSRDLSALAEECETYEVSTKYQGSPPSSFSQDGFVPTPAERAQFQFRHSVAKLGSFRVTNRFLRKGDVLEMCLTAVEGDVHVMTKYLSLAFFEELPTGNTIPEICWVQCKLRDRSALSKLADSSRCVDVMNITPGSEVTLEEGSIHATTDLLLVAGDEVLSVKYSKRHSQLENMSAAAGEIHVYQA